MKDDQEIKKNRNDVRGYDVSTVTVKQEGHDDCKNPYRYCEIQDKGDASEGMRQTHKTLATKCVSCNSQPTLMIHFRTQQHFGEIKNEVFFKERGLLSLKGPVR